MPSEFSHPVALQREVFAVSLDPLTNRESKRGYLPARTLIEDPYRVLDQAAVSGLQEVVVRSRDSSGWTGFERVNADSLRAALPERTG